MARGTPSLVALLGLLAVAGYQNRDKLGDLLNGAGGQPGGAGNPNGQQGGLEGMLGNLGGALGGLASGAGLGDLVDSFRQTGRNDKIDSWVGTGDNAPVEAADLEDVLGEDTITELTLKTGLSRSDLLERLSKTLPDAVNHLTPNGQIPRFNS